MILLRSTVYEKVFKRTHTVEVVKDLVHSDNFVIQFVVAVGCGQECVSVGYEHVEQVYHLEKETRFREITYEAHKIRICKKN